MVKFKKSRGYADGSVIYLRFEIEGGDNNESIGDQVWFSPCGTQLHVSDMAEQDVLEELLELFEPASRMAFKGAMRRMGVVIEN